MVNILWMTRKGEAYVGAPSTRHGFEQAVNQITHSVFAGEEWPLHIPNERLEDTVERLMPDVDWVIDKDLNLHVKKPVDLNVAHFISDLHGKHHYGVTTPGGHIDLLNRVGYRTIFLRYPEIHGTSSPSNVYKYALKPNGYWVPWSFDPKRFHPHRTSRYEATFIGSTNNSVYPLRAQIRAELEKLGETHKVFLAESPRGRTFERRIADHLAGNRYAEVLGQSNMFIFDCSKYRYPLQKFFEGLGSGCLVMATKPGGAEALGLIDGKTYVEINPVNWRDKLHYYLENLGAARKIANSGHKMALKYHTHDVRAKQFVRYLKLGLNSPKQTITGDDVE